MDVKSSFLQRENLISGAIFQGMHSEFDSPTPDKPDSARGIQFSELLDECENDEKQHMKLR